MLLRAFIVWVLTALLRKADPDFDKRLTAFEQEKKETVADEAVKQQEIERDQATIAADQVTDADLEQQRAKLKADADQLAQQRKELRDDAEKNRPARPSDDDLLSGPLPGAS